ncbi:MAG: hypothetical protein ACT4O5_00755 [Gammaproteobacteria bacterium]
MQAATLEVLEKADVPAPQARAFAQAIEIELAAQRDTLATKLDLTELRRDLEVRIESVRGELKGDIQGLRAELKGDIHGLRAELKGDIQDLGAKLKGDSDGLRAELKGDTHGLRVEMHGIKSELVRWVFLVVMGQTAVLLGAAYFFLNQLTAVIR